MPPRNRPKPCHNCPKPKSKKAPPAAISQPVDLPEAEGIKLWKHVLFGTTTCLNMIEGYAKFNMPGDPLEGVTHLRDRLNSIIQMLKDRP